MVFSRPPLNPFYLLYPPFFLCVFYRLVLFFRFLCVPLLLQLGQDTPSPTLEYFLWGIHIEHGTFDINTTAANDTKGLMVTMNVYTAPDQYQTELELYKKNCFVAIDANEGSLGALIISSSILDTGHDVNSYDMQEITVKINSTNLTDHPVWTDGITNAIGYDDIFARTNIFHPGINGGNKTDDILVSFKEVEFRIDVDLTDK